MAIKKRIRKADYFCDALPANTTGSKFALGIGNWACCRQRYKKRFAAALNSSKSSEETVEWLKEEADVQSNTQ